MHKVLAALVMGLGVMGLGVMGPPRASAQMSSGTPQLLAKHLVDIGGGRRLNLVCMGRGSPTLVFEYAMGGAVLNWQKIQVPASKISRVCFYDRAGYGFSDPSPWPMTATAVTDDLHALLRRAGVRRPVVLVGHSLGGLYATLYADRFSAEVAGLVLIDPSVADPPQIPPQSQAQKDAELEKDRIFFRTCAELARAGKLSLSDRHDCIWAAPNHTPMELDYVAQISRPSLYESMLSEEISGHASDAGPDEDSLEETRANRPFGAMPVIVLTHGRKDASPNAEAFRVAIKARHEQLAARSSRGESRLVPDAGHYIQLDQPEAVVDALRKVVAEVREDQRRP